MNRKKKEYRIYTDGGYSNRRNIGAFACVIIDPEDNEVLRFAEKLGNTDKFGNKETNNTAEIKAIFAGLVKCPDDATSIRFFSDSQYAINVCKGSWQRKKNVQLLSLYDEWVAKRGIDIQYEWVKGHNGNYYNEVCDQLCNDAAGINLNDRSEFIPAKVSNEEAMKLLYGEAKN